MSFFAQTRIFGCVPLFRPNLTVLLRLTIGGGFVKFSICVVIIWLLITLVVRFRSLAPNAARGPAAPARRGLLPLSPATIPQSSGDQTGRHHYNLSHLEQCGGDGGLPKFVIHIIQ